MTKRPYPLAVVIGRWQLPHLAHQAMINHAFGLADQVAIVIGSAHKARDPKNPFTAEEREDMLSLMLTPEQHQRVCFVPVEDYYNDQEWAQAVIRGVDASQGDQDGDQQRCVLVGYGKDDPTAAYLALFPQWKYIDAGTPGDMDATTLRWQFFGGEGVTQESLTATGVEAIRGSIDAAVADYLNQWIADDKARYDRIGDEMRSIAAYRKKYTAPFYLTADALVEARRPDGERFVLLIQRGGTIGHGLWALPGGFVDANERFEQAARRELAEETGLSVDGFSLIGSRVFDHPGRSLRGRLITNAFHFSLNAKAGLPEVIGCDDAQNARWYAVSELSSLRGSMFEDHWQIISSMLGR